MRILIITILATAISVLSTGPAHADLGDQLAKLLADDGAHSDYFGESVAMSGITVIVGAWQDDDNGSLSGSAYLFDTTTGLQIAKMLPDDGAMWDQFGFSVAINGATAIVGAPGDDEEDHGSGSAYLFDLSDPANPIQIAKLLHDDGAAADLFGASVAINGVTAIVGAYWDDENGSKSGSAYLFDISDPKNVVQIAKLLPDDGAVEDWFGYSVAINGTTAIVGAFLDDDNGFNSGSVYLFDTTMGRQTAKLLPDDGAAQNLFGYSVAINPDGVGAIVGARWDNDNGSASGSAYLFDTTTGRQIAKLLPEDGATVDLFGWSVAISGVTAVVGAQRDDDNGTDSGSAYLFDITTGRQIAKLLANDGAAFDAFGWSVAISGPTAIVGAWGNDDNGSNSGSAYLFDAFYCPWDLDGTGTVGVSDLLTLLASWGPCKDCPADFDNDGTVGYSDLEILLANWESCA